MNDIDWETLPSTVAGIPLPVTNLTAAAFRLTKRYLTPALLAHSLRSFFFSCMLADRDTIRYDRELLFLAALMHDLGLSEQVSTPGNRFEADGANAAKAFLMRNGYPLIKSERVWDAIALHDIYPLAKHKAAEVRYCSLGIGLDAEAAQITSTLTNYARY